MDHIIKPGNTTEDLVKILFTTAKNGDTIWVVNELYARVGRAFVERMYPKLHVEIKVGQPGENNATEME